VVIVSLSGFAQALRALAYPPSCSCCREPLSPDQGAASLCQICRDAVEPLPEPVCSRCGEPLTVPSVEHVCDLRPLAMVRSAAIYGGTTAQLIMALKFSGRTAAASVLAAFVAQTAATAALLADAEVIVPVPLSLRRRVGRGYNQSALIAYALPRELRAKVVLGVLRRLRHTHAQAILAAPARMSNVAGAFGLRQPALVRGRRVCLLDDVISTGATVRACAAALDPAEPASVAAVSVARAV
jgi:ComF family protein